MGFAKLGQAIIETSQSNSDWLPTTQSVVLPADWLIMENNENYIAVKLGGLFILYDIALLYVYILLGIFETS